MAGGFHYMTRIRLGDGSAGRIGFVVNQRARRTVLGQDPVSGEIRTRRITGWHREDPPGGFLAFTVRNPGGSGRSHFSCTPGQMIRTPSGWVAAADLQAGDRVMQRGLRRISPRQWEIVRGGLMGDSSISPANQGLGGRYRFGHGAPQDAYARWKIRQLRNLVSWSGRNDVGGISTDLTQLQELGQLRKEVYQRDGRKEFSQAYLDSLTPLSLAIWYQDDGGFDLRSKGVQVRTAGGSGRVMICIQAMNPATRERLHELLRGKLGGQVHLRQVRTTGQWYLLFNREATDSLHDIVAPYIIPSMQYKLTPRVQGLTVPMPPQFQRPVECLCETEILAVVPKPVTRSVHRFRLSLEGGADYFVDGILARGQP